jgi:hypothetical protein
MSNSGAKRLKFTDIKMNQHRQMCGGALLKLHPRTYFSLTARSDNLIVRCYGLLALRWGARWRSWLRRCATRPKVADSIHGRTKSLGSNQPSKKRRTRNISWGGKRGRCLGLTPLPLSCTDCLEIWEPPPPGSFRPCPDLSRDCFTFYSYYEPYSYCFQSSKIISLYNMLRTLKSCMESLRVYDLNTDW